MDSRQSAPIRGFLTRLDVDVLGHTARGHAEWLMNNLLVNQVRRRFEHSVVELRDSFRWCESCGGRVDGLFDDEASTSANVAPAFISRHAVRLLSQSAANFANALNRQLVSDRIPTVCTFPGLDEHLKQ
jgi:hypothetical protein